MGSTCLQDYEGVLWDDGWIISLASTRYTINRRNEKNVVPSPTRMIQVERLYARVRRCINFPGYLYQVPAARKSRINHHLTSILISQGYRPRGIAYRCNVLVDSRLGLEKYQVSIGSTFSRGDLGGGQVGDVSSRRVCGKSVECSNLLL